MMTEYEFDGLNTEDFGYTPDTGELVENLVVRFSGDLSFSALISGSMDDVGRQLVSLGERILDNDEMIEALNDKVADSMRGGWGHGNAWDARIDDLIKRYREKHKVEGKK